MNRVLNVFFNAHFIGTLTETHGKVLSFSYDKEAQHAISVSMPISQTPYRGHLVRAFFENLLPEGELIDLVAKAHNVSAQNPFSLLKVIGEDCAGALSLSTSKEISTILYPKPLSPLEFDDYIVKSSSLTPIYQKGMRLSLAGAQFKTTLIKHEDSYYVPSTQFPSTHIIKFFNPRYPDLLINETFCTNLANLLNLPTIKLNLLFTHNMPYLLIERYDRILNETHYDRIHQEDFCQILGTYHTQKYQHEGGPSFRKISDAISSYSKYAAKDKLQLAKVAIFNYLIGNCDYHAKNLSILHHPDIQLTPFYDLVSTAIYPDLSSDMAMSIYKVYPLNDITKDNFIAEFNQWGLNGKALFNQIIKDFKDILVKAKQLAKHHTFERFEATTTSIIKIIEKNFNQLMKKDID